MLIIAVYALGLSLLCAYDVIKYRSNILKNSYFESKTFKNDLHAFFYNVNALNTSYKGFLGKTIDEKVSYDEAKSMKDGYDYGINDKVSEFQRSYKAQIDEAEKSGDKEKVKRIVEEQNRVIENYKNQNAKTVEDIKKIIAEYKGRDYANIMMAVDNKKDLKYYISDKKSGQIYTNINESSNKFDINNYAGNRTIYSIKFPQTRIKDSSLQWINQVFKANNWEGYLLVSSNAEDSSQIYANIQYYDSMRTRVIKEIILFIISLSAAIALLVFAEKKMKEDIPSLEKAREIYIKIPFDLKTIIFIFTAFLMNSYLENTYFFYKPLQVKQFFILTIIAIFMAYVVVNIKIIYESFKERKDIKTVWKKTYFYKVFMIFKESFAVKSVAFKVVGLIILTMIFGICMVASTRRYRYEKFAYLLIYIFTVPYYLLKKIAYLNKIIKGTEEITGGNLNYTVEESGKSNLYRLAHNINNMKEGFRKSVESEMKSERLKSELITNVSHDLKTPLTSIINYVNLLKREGLTKDEADGYIAVLDRKTERLKTIIDDLFEASKMASGSVELDIKRVDVVALLNQAIGELDEKIKKSSLTFKINTSKQNMYAELDGKKTWRLFDNLINNILKYSQPNTRVYIDITEGEENIIITMKNISSYEMDFAASEIFERFKRGDKSRNTEGSGLGLAIAKSIAELQGGRLNIEIDGDLFKAITEFPVSIA